MGTKTILIENAGYLVTVDEDRRVLKGASVLIEDNIIKNIFTGGEKLPKADTSIDASGKIVLPGLVNTHHHLFQTLFRGVDLLKKQEILPWVKTMSELCEGLDYDALYTSVVAGMAELVLSGCTTTSDNLYVYPYGQNELFDATVKAAESIGIRFHPVRGYIENERGLWPKSMTQSDDEIIKESRKAIKKFHDPLGSSMCRVSVGPVGYYTSSTNLFKKIIRLARNHNVGIHTHTSESLGTEEFCIKNFGVREIEYLESVNCLGDDVWLAHCIYVNEKEIEKLGTTKTGVSHCPVCNMGKKKGCTSYSNVGKECKC